MVANFEKMKHELDIMGRKALQGARKLAVMSGMQKNVLLNAMADAICAAEQEIIDANKIDIEAYKDKLSSALLDRLTLTPARIKSMAEGLRTVAVEADPVGRILSSEERPNGIKIEKVSVPIGVIGIIFESRPNVCCDAAGICLKAGNAVILRGGKEAFNSNMKIIEVMNRCGSKAGLPDGAIQLVPWLEHEAVTLLVQLDKYVSLIIPRGGERLIRAVVKESTIPVIKHYKGVCHAFVDKGADFAMALNIIKNGKCQRPGVCNALECVLLHKDIAMDFLPILTDMLNSEKVKMYGDEFSCKYGKNVILNLPDDYFTEFLDLAINLKVVDDVKAAVEHINHYGSGHSDCIISYDQEDIEFFFNNVDSSAVYNNASTRFTDGGEFGKGAEIGISTDKLHARGPMGAKELTIYKYIIRGNGQIRG